VFSVISASVNDIPQLACYLFLLPRLVDMRYINNTDRSMGWCLWKSLQ